VQIARVLILRLRHVTSLADCLVGRVSQLGMREVTFIPVLVGDLALGRVANRERIRRR
jgi:hypothetical protein